MPGLVVVVSLLSALASSADGHQAQLSEAVGSLHRKMLPVLNTKSGLRPWVDIDTPEDKQIHFSSRGEAWELVMSDEFTNTNRSFQPGEDPMWTSLEKPDGVNGALELYSHNMSSVVCEDSSDDSTESLCYLQIKIIDEVNTVSVYNLYTNPPGYENTTFYYRSAMLQSWNKFCFQGGLLEVRVQLPAAVDAQSQNPDLGQGDNARASTIAYYPTWPGIWAMGNLGRAIFSASTYRMWPFSYNECSDEVFNSTKNQRISGCDPDPGSGMNPFQGRGAPEIDLLEGGGTAISSSIQIGPGLPLEFRRFPVNKTLDPVTCVYVPNCETPGANFPNVPTKLYETRSFTSWYSGLRYASNNFCAPMPSTTQTYDQIARSYALGITENTCSLTSCAASNDVQGDLGYIDGDASKGRWGINTEGTCMANLNAYQGTYLCDPDSQNPECNSPRAKDAPPTKSMAPFNYQMDALSANWGIHVGAYTSFLVYQIEWVTGEAGYIRWMSEGQPIFEIPAESVTQSSQDEQPKPTRTFPEEPMYLILNVAISAQWGAIPPNPGKPCRGDGADPVVNHICDSFPMFMKIDYVRLYQDVSNTSTMTLGCDPNSHPTRKWIQDHMEDYIDDVNIYREVHGAAPCSRNQDCTIPWSKARRFTTGFCSKRNRCVCSTKYWGGPRCTFQLASTSINPTSYGPSLLVTILFAALAIACMILVHVAHMQYHKSERHTRMLREEKLRTRKPNVNEDVGSTTTVDTPSEPEDDESELSKSGGSYHNFAD